MKFVLAVMAATAALAMPASASVYQDTPRTFEGCQVTLRINTGSTYVEAKGLMNIFDSHEPGFEYAEMFGVVGERGTGDLAVQTIDPPLDISDAKCPPMNGPATPRTYSPPIH